MFEKFIIFAPMKKVFFICLLVFVAVLAHAVPVMPGQYKTITLADGRIVKVEAKGDEFLHYWRSEAGDAYVQNAIGQYEKADVHALEEQVTAQRAEVNEARMARFEKYFGKKYGEVKPGMQKSMGDFKQLEGVKKGIVIMAQFADDDPKFKFAEGHTPEYYKQVLNECGPTEVGYIAGVKQYFLDQSNGKFTVDFDVTPIVTLPYSHGTYTHDVRSIIKYALTVLPEEIDWTQYDWDKDGEVDQVFVLFAGYGQASKSDDETLIWPHESTLGYSCPTIDGVKINTYACSNELYYKEGKDDTDMGIGTFCHEFAHCLGYPDIYDVCGNGSGEACGTTSMGIWDLLDSGSYNGVPGFKPAPFSAFEKMTAGWVTPKELEVDKEYSNLRPITDVDGGDVYMLTNPANKNEYYFLEPIRNESWGSGFYKSKGLLVIHVDYADSPWKNNVVNCKRFSYNDRSRYTYIPADGGFESEKTSQIRGDLFGSSVHETELFWYSGQSVAEDKCKIKLTNIVVDANGVLSYKTVSAEEVGPDGIQSVTESAEQRLQSTGKYNLNGQKVSDGYKGFIIKSGKKVLQ